MDETPSQEPSPTVPAMSYDEAAKYLKISESTLRKLVRARRVSVRKLSPRNHYFLLEDLDDYWKRSKQKAI